MINLRKKEMKRKKNRRKRQRTRAPYLESEVSRIVLGWKGLEENGKDFTECGSPFQWEASKHVVLVIFTFMSLPLSSDGKLLDNIVFISESAKDSKNASQIEA